MKKTVLFAVMISVVMMCLCGCSVGFVNGSAVSYDNADKYTAGDREITDKIDTLDIDWVSGKVTVSAGGSTVKVKETTDADLDDNLKVHTWADGSTLHVRFCKSGERYSKSAEKTLEITVPSETVFEDIKVNTSSADIVCEGVAAKTAEMDSSSGELTYNGNAGSFDADSSSGNISFSGIASDIDADSSSGQVTIDQKGDAQSIEVSTSSGEIEVDCEYTDTLKASSSSGDKDITLRKMPKEVSVSSSSGKLDITLPEDAGFTAEIDTSSGDVSYDLPMSKTGDDTYTCGSGENKLSISASSGDVKINKLG